MISVKISTLTGQMIHFITQAAKVEYEEHFLKVTDERGNVYRYSCSHLIEVEEWIHENEYKRQ